VITETVKEDHVGEDAAQPKKDLETVCEEEDE
jgi:hypothetical protein